MTIDNISFKRPILHKFLCMVCVSSRNIYGIFGTLKIWPKNDKVHALYECFYYTPRLWRVGCNSFDMVCVCVCAVFQTRQDNLPPAGRATLKCCPPCQKVVRPHFSRWKHQQIQLSLDAIIYCIILCKLTRVVKGVKLAFEKYRWKCVERSQLFYA